MCLVEYVYVSVYGIFNFYNINFCEYLFCYVGFWIVFCGKYCFYSVLFVINFDWCIF